MNPTISFGPLALPFSVLLLFIATGVGLFVGKRSARRRGVEVEGTLIRILVFGLVVARVAFVLQYRQTYLDDPLSIFDIRDGGWAPQAGLIGAWFYATALAPRTRRLRRPMFTGLATASAILIAGMIVMALPSKNSLPLPDFAATTLDGDAVVLTRFIGKPTVINLWATWCPPCRREMPMLAKAQTELPTVNFVFLNQGESPEIIKKFLVQTGLDMDNMLRDPKGDVAREFHQRGLPATLFFDAEGHLDSSRLGALSRATLTEGVDRLIARSVNRGD